MAKAAEKAYEVIRDGIVAGAYPVGGRLREEELAGSIGVSRTPVREALRRLDAEGLVEFLPNRGAHVASWSDHDLEEIFGLRAVLESYGAGLAATRVGPADLVLLRDLAAAMEEAGHHHQLDVVAELNNRFHHTILRAAGNTRLVGLLSGLVQVALVHRTFRRYSPEALARSFAHHRELVAAFEAGDPEWASSVMRSHVLAARAVPDGSAGDGEQAPRAGSVRRLEGRRP
jgi:DNA-binding GntR family transcriptional regulator